MSEDIKQTQMHTPQVTTVGQRTEKIGIIVSNKMIKTVVVRVERQVRHQKYKKFIRRRTNFMAHVDRSEERV